MSIFTRDYSAEAERVSAAILHFAENPDALYNFECYISRHFGTWLVKWAGTPEGMAAELERFAHMYDPEEAREA